MLRESESCYAAIPPYVMFVDNEDMRGGCECSSTCQCSNGVTPQLTSSRDSAINSGGIHFYNMDYYD